MLLIWYILVVGFIVEQISAFRFPKVPSGFKHKGLTDTRLTTTDISKASIALKLICLPKCNKLQDYETLLKEHCQQQNCKIIRWYISRLTSDNISIEATVHQFPS